MPGIESKPLVSILIPAYNAERWIRQCLDSALAQTYPAAEVIVVDDGSSDGTVAAIRQYADRVRLVEAPHEGGNAARNRLTALAQGEWLQFLDADDYLLPEKIADQMDRIASAPELDAVFCLVILRNESTGSERVLEIGEKDDFTTPFIRWGSLNTNGFLFRRQAVLDVGGWAPNQLACQEHELLLRLICAEKRFQLVHRPGAVYRYHGESTVSRKDPLRTLHLKLEILDKLQDYLERNGKITAQHRKEFYASRMEAARTAWDHDPALALRLDKKARSTGTWWVTFSPALPSSFQFARCLLGFAGAQRLAALARRGDRTPVSV